MAENQTSITTPTNTNMLQQAEMFYEKNKKNILIVLAAIAVLALAYLLYTKLYLPKKEQEAQAAIFTAQNYFKLDSFAVALNGDGEHEGFIDIIDNYGGTKASNLAKMYAGICELNMGKFDDAVNHLKSYSPNDKMSGAMATGAIGDAYMELNKVDEGLSYYKKAATSNDNELTAPMWWLKYGNACEHFNKIEEAKGAYEIITKKYSQTSFNRDAERFLARVEARLQSEK